MALATVVLIASLAGLGWFPQADAGVAQPPHIFFILVDDLGYANVGFNRAVKTREVVTPALDGLVETGIHLTRHYVHQYCTPTRTSVQSGRLPVHVNTGLGNPCSDNTGIAYNMTGFAEKLQGAGYTTAFAGKWDAGMATPRHPPHGRGYNTSLNYFSHKNDFWSQANMQTCCEQDQTIIDFWRTDHGAADVNSTGYSEFLYRDELVGVVQKQSPSNPLLLFYTPHVAHCPLQVPKEIYEQFDFMDDDEGHCAAQTVKGLHSIDPHFPELPYKCRQQYHSMVNIMDGVVGNITNAMKTKGMWSNTLVVMSSDNGGPVDLAENAANNWPLRGGKYSLFEGGIRVAAFVSGGIIPPSLRGTTNNGIVHIADWYATFCHLADVNAYDERAAAAIPPVPPIDSISMWDFLMGKTKVSPRQSQALPVGSNCLVLGDYKLITSATSPNFWQGPKFPNSSSSFDDSRSGLVEAELEAQALFGGEAAAPPPRPFPRLAKCGDGTNASLSSLQQWGGLSSGSIPTTVCGQKTGCWNIQNSESRLILWAQSTTSNALFQLVKDDDTEQDGIVQGRLWSPLLPKSACIGAEQGEELKVYHQCPTKDNTVETHFMFDEETGRVSTTNGLCVTADVNGTTFPKGGAGGNHGGGNHNGVCASGCLFNVVEDHTEQHNLINDSAQSQRIASMTAALNAEREKFWSNSDKFTNNCPSNLDPETDLGCACWMAKHRYGGFMGPYALLGK